MTPPNLLHSAAGWLVTLLAPFALVLIAVRLLMTPAWVNLEYRMPGFPDDLYGFTLQDRLKWSLVSLEYLLNDSGIEFLAGQRFESDDVPIYNNRELGHMIDVKNVVQSALAVMWGSIIVIILTGFWSKLGGWGPVFRVALARGGWLTIGFVGVVLVFVVVAFSGFFVFFHEVFFAPGTWTFSTSDTLIRLFPIRFWQDAFLWVGGLTIMESLWLISMVRNTPS